MSRLTGAQIWEADVEMLEVGETQLTDREIERLGEYYFRHQMAFYTNQSTAEAAVLHLKSQKGEKYRLIDNNCQWFVIELLRGILGHQAVAEMLGENGKLHVRVTAQIGFILRAMYLDYM